jgi:hypothetical protein
VRLKLDQLIHVLRAASEISGEKNFVLVGSQAVLLALSEPDARLTMSDEIDLYPSMAPEKADMIDGAIGALSRFHDTFGYYADGVSPETATMPPDWMKRSSLHYFGEITAICPDLTDLCVAKVAAGREKDAEFVAVLLSGGDVQLHLLLERIRSLDQDRAAIDSMVNWAQRRAQEAGIA